MCRIQGNVIKLVASTAALAVSTHSLLCFAGSKRTIVGATGIRSNGRHCRRGPSRVLGNLYNLMMHNSPFLKIERDFGDRPVRFDAKIDSVDPTPIRHAGFPLNCAVLNSYTSLVRENQRSRRICSSCDICKNGSNAYVTNATIKQIKVYFVDPGWYRDGSCGSYDCRCRRHLL